MFYKNIKWMPKLLIFGFLGTIHSGYCFETSTEYHAINDTQAEFVNEFVWKRYSKENDNPENFINTSQCHIPYVDPLSPEVGLATLANIMPLLTGHNESTAENICKPNQVGGYDQCNFIWKKFHTQHYKTAYAEDNTFISTFNYASPGFKEQPTDYYFRPMALAIEKTLNQTLRHGLTYCVGNRQYAEYVYDSGLRFAKRFQYQAHFGIFWTNSFSHNHYSLPATMDSTTLKYLRDMERVGYFDNAIVFFLSDHGKLFHPLDKLPEAFLEDRLPTFFISIPKWFHYTHPELIKNLETNCQRLTSPYDIYMTMQHLLKINQPYFDIEAATGCTRCQSLFEEVPENRTCLEAGIPVS
uniref:Sulfatase N-terminal domain-containing protein n=1 Tax=Glossina morsitans morsitans TaxID=37546 RepID=A0A1B0FNT8_GLOMM